MLFMEDSQPTDDVDSSSIGKKLNVISKFDLFIYSPTISKPNTLLPNPKWTKIIVLRFLFILDLGAEC